MLLPHRRGGAGGAGADSGGSATGGRGAADALSSLSSRPKWRDMRRASLLTIAAAVFVSVSVTYLLMRRGPNIASAERDALTQRQRMRALEGEHTHWQPWRGEDGKFTVYMITYDRDELCKRLVAHYAKSPKVDKIVLSWNNLGRAPPALSEFELGGTEMIIVTETVDSLNNRFKPHDFITTDAIFTVDDDILIPLDIVEFAFSIWKQFPTTIVGFSQYVRMHGHMPTFQECTKEPNSQQWYYSAECHNSESNKVYNGPKPFPVASIALDSAMFFHKMYLDMYTEDLDPRILAHVDEVRNCEDLAMPMLVAHHTRLPPVTVDAPGMEHLQDLNKKNHHPGLNTMQGHYEKRTKCLNVMADIFGYMPLQYSNFKMQPFPEGEVL